MLPFLLPHHPTPAQARPRRVPSALDPAHDAQSRLDQGVWSLPSSPAADGPVCTCPFPAHRRPLPVGGEPPLALLHVAPMSTGPACPQPLPAPTCPPGLRSLLLHFALLSPGRPASSHPGGSPAGRLLPFAGCGQGRWSFLPWGVDSTPRGPHSVPVSSPHPDLFLFASSSQHIVGSLLFLRKERASLKFP